ncbi:hypothetical protein [Adonisia turfae]|uniref:Uncharacterized protein n=1 Tax=Adonisia turfae CCMR0081 TaxID=2292702 RepID=A0A6M0RM92_9CYAN|nr:hypothetical protein [Adonisia turfae]NEZ57348.1 hypothetical protein [Adonisia turfae CCMR0081]
MLLNSESSQTSTVGRLTKIWAARYLPDLSILSIENALSVRDKLQGTVSEQGRAYTANKLNKRLVEDRCNLAAVRAKNLYSFYKNSDLRKIASIAKLVSRIYLKIIEMYQDPSAIVLSSYSKPDKSFDQSSLAAWGLPKIDRLALELSPLLLDLQERYRVSHNWQSVGFITTQITLSNALLLEELTPLEQIFVKCYFKFLEEQVCLPWQRLCIAVRRYSLYSPIFEAVELMLSRLTRVSTRVYERWANAFPHYISHRGDLTDPKVRQSSIRDFDMFQAYLCVCLLEEDATVIEQELSAICLIVYGALNIPWDMTVEGTLLLMHEISTQLKPYHKQIAEPYLEMMTKTFSHRRFAS